jgi:hypothetical protein
MYDGTQSQAQVSPNPEQRSLGS